MIRTILQPVPLWDTAAVCRNAANFTPQNNCEKWSKYSLSSLSCSFVKILLLPVFRPPVIFSFKYFLRLGYSVLNCPSKSRIFKKFRITTDTPLTTRRTVRKSNPGVGEIFRTRPDRPWGTPSLLYYEYRVSFPGSKETRLKEEYSYTPTPPLALHGLFYGVFHLYLTFLKPPKMAVLFFFKSRGPETDACTLPPACQYPPPVCVY